MTSRKMIFRIACILGLIILICLYFRQCEKVKELKVELNQSSQKTDTLFLDKPFEIPKPYPVYLNPEKVIVYLPDTTSRKFELISLTGKDVVLHTTSSKDSLLIDNIFLSSYPLNEKLVHMGLTKKSLSLVTLDIRGVTKESQYQINPEKYNYSYSLNNLTSKRVKGLTLKPYVEYQYRVFNNFQDLKLGLDFKTTNFNYEIGVGGFYYPSLQKNPGWDISIGIKYNF